jgi:hypothetical protein
LLPRFRLVPEWLFADPLPDPTATMLASMANRINRRRNKGHNDLSETLVRRPARDVT